MSDDKPRDSSPDTPRPDDLTRPDDRTQPVRAEGPEVDEPTARPAPEPATESAPESAPGSAPAAATAASAERRGFHERLRRVRTSDGSRTFSLGALIASALAGVIVGGLGAAALHAVADDGPRHHGPWVQRWDDERGPGFGGRDGMHGWPGGGPGRLPPTMPPDDDGTDS